MGCSLGVGVLIVQKLKHVYCFPIQLSFQIQTTPLSLACVLSSRCLSKTFFCVGLSESLMKLFVHWKPRSVKVPNFLIVLKKLCFQSFVSFNYKFHFFNHVSTDNCLILFNGLFWRFLKFLVCTFHQNRDTRNIPRSANVVFFPRFSFS